MSSRRLRVTWAVALAALTGCASAGAGGPSDLPVRELAGHFTGGTGSSWFRPCAPAPGDTLWWATFMGRAVTQRDSLQQAGRITPGAPAYLRVRAGISELQSAGANGRGTRYLYVQEVLAARVPTGVDCGG